MSRIGNLKGSLFTGTPLTLVETPKEEPILKEIEYFMMTHGEVSWNMRHQWLKDQLSFEVANPTDKKMDSLVEFMAKNIDICKTPYLVKNEFGHVITYSKRKSARMMLQLMKSEIERMNNLEVKKK